MSEAGNDAPGCTPPLASVALGAALDPPRAQDGERPSGETRRQAEDFRVEELLGFTPQGEGQHLWLFVEKRELNTEQAARILARACAVPARDVGYAGLKDRNAVTRQWFSVPVTDSSSERVARGGELATGLTVIDAVRHVRKLRRGANRGNRFEILVRTPSPGDGAESVAKLVEQVRARGVPNYFGAQRFGRNGANLEKALSMFSAPARRVPRHLRSLYLSSARSLLFNQVLARRVAERSWDRLLPGEAVILDGRNSYFLSDDTDPELAGRLAGFDIHPSGPLWGKGEPVPGADVVALEAEVIAEFMPLSRGLEEAGLTQERRALRLVVIGLEVCVEAGLGYRLRFELPSGAYATTVLREIFDLQ